MTGRQPDDLILLAEEKSVCGNNKCVDAAFVYGREAGIDLRLIVGVEGHEFLTKRACRSLQVFHLVLGIWIAWLRQRPKHRRLGY